MCVRVCLGIECICVCGYLSPDHLIFCLHSLTSPTAFPSISTENSPTQRTSSAMPLSILDIKSSLGFATYSLHFLTFPHPSLSSIVRLGVHQIKGLLLEGPRHHPRLLPAALHPQVLETQVYASNLLQAGRTQHLWELKSHTAAPLRRLVVCQEVLWSWVECDMELWYCCGVKMEGCWSV